jgi:DNA polymerase III delta subunit
VSEEKMSQDKKVAAETKLTKEEKLFEEKKTVDSYIARFVESMAKTNTKKITKEILEGLSEDTGDTDSFNVESGDEDSEDRP